MLAELEIVPIGARGASLSGVLARHPAFLILLGILFLGSGQPVEGRDPVPVDELPGQLCDLEAAGQELTVEGRLSILGTHCLDRRSDGACLRCQGERVLTSDVTGTQPAHVAFTTPMIWATEPDPVTKNDCLLEQPYRDRPMYRVRGRLAANALSQLISGAAAGGVPIVRIEGAISEGFVPERAPGVDAAVPINAGDAASAIPKVSFGAGSLGVTHRAVSAAIPVNQLFDRFCRVPAHALVLRGIGGVGGLTFCTAMYCPGDCCNTCGATGILKGDMVQLALRGIHCSGTECGVTCPGLSQGATYDVVGTLALETETRSGLWFRPQSIREVSGSTTDSSATITP